MKILLITQDNPLYITESIGRLISKLAPTNEIVGCIVSNPSPFGKKESFYRKTLKTYKIFGFKFFTYFFPSGVPIGLAPLLIPIEIISYFIRPISLSVRLFANMLAGHTMMKVFAGLIIMMGSASGILKVGAILPLMAVIGLTGLEFLVAALQAYVFSILTCMYLHDALHLH